MKDPHDGERKVAEVWWWGQSKDAISNFPDRVKVNLGYSLRLLQRGDEPTDYRPLPSVAKGLFELRDQDKDGWYRVIYLSRTNDVIHVVHAFQKDTREIPENQKTVARQNLKAVRSYQREEKKHAKRKK